MLAKVINFLVAILFLLSGVNLPSTNCHEYDRNHQQISERKLPSSLNSIAWLSAALDEDENDELDEHVAIIPYFNADPSYTSANFYSLLNYKLSINADDRLVNVPLFLQNRSIRC